MAIAFVSALANPWSGNGATTQQSQSFTPAAGDTILVWESMFNTSAQPLTCTGSSGAYPIINPPGQWADTEADAYAIYGQLSSAGGAQTITVGGASISTCIGHWTRFSGVGSITTVTTGGVNNAAPGTSPGAVVGLSVTVPLGAVLVSWCSSEDDLETISVANSGSTANSANDVGSNLTLCVGYWAGTGGPTQPQFTVSVGTHNYIVLQAILNPPPATVAIAWVT